MIPNLTEKDYVHLDDGEGSHLEHVFSRSNFLSEYSQSHLFGEILMEIYKDHGNSSTSLVEAFSGQ